MNSGILRILFYGVKHGKINHIPKGFCLKTFIIPNGFRCYASREQNKFPLNFQFKSSDPNEIIRSRFTKLSMVVAWMAIGGTIGVIGKMSYNYYQSKTENTGVASSGFRDWEEDVVYLYQFPRPRDSLNYSPYCLKVETFLRMHGIKYKIMPPTFWKSMGENLPYVEMNGEQIADPELIFMKLKEHFRIKEENLNKEQTAISKMLERSIDKGIYTAANYFKFKSHMPEWSELLLKSLGLSDFVAKELRLHAAFWLTSKIDARYLVETTARYSRKDILEILRKDLDAIDTILGDKDFLLGRKPSEADVTLFAHTAAIYYTPYKHEIKEMLENDFPRIKRHMDRMKALYYRDEVLEN